MEMDEKDKAQFKLKVNENRQIFSTWFILIGLI